MTATSVRAVTPTMPLDFVGSKGQIRQLADGSWTTWDGHDWVPTVIPAGQVAGSSSYVQKLADGAVQLSNGLYVTGTAPETNGNDSLWVAGNSHTTGNHTVDGNVYADDVRIKGSRYLSNYGDGYSYESRITSAGALTTGENYLGAGVTWTYNAKERLKFTYKATLAPGGVNNAADAEWRLSLFGSGSYTGSVNTADQHYDVTVVPMPVGSDARITIMGVHYLPPGTWADGAVCYLALSAQTLFATNSNWSRNGSGISFWPASLLKEVIGYVP